MTQVSSLSSWNPSGARTLLPGAVARKGCTATQGASAWRPGGTLSLLGGMATYVDADRVPHPLSSLRGQIAALNAGPALPEETHLLEARAPSGYPLTVCVHSVSSWCCQPVSTMSSFLFPFVPSSKEFPPILNTCLCSKYREAVYSLQNSQWGREDFFKRNMFLPSIFLCISQSHV